jgi:hypothetical protein
MAGGALKVTVRSRDAVRGAKRRYFAVGVKVQTQLLF